MLRCAKEETPRSLCAGPLFTRLLGREPDVHRGDGAGVRVPSSLHQQSNKAPPALWFEPQRCKSRNAHLRDFLEQQFHIFFDKLAGVAAGRSRSAPSLSAIATLSSGSFSAKAPGARRKAPSMKSKSPSSRRNSGLYPRAIGSCNQRLAKAGEFIGVGAPRMVVFKKIAATISAVAFVMLAVALAPGVPTVLATVAH